MATLPVSGPAHDIKALIARQGYSASVAKEVVSILRQSLAEVSAYLASPAAAKLNANDRAQLERLREFTQARVSEAMFLGSKIATTNLNKYMKVELNAAHLQGVAVSGVLGLPARSTMISAARLAQIVETIDVGGVGFGQWWGKAANDIVGNTMRTVQIGLVRGKHPRDIVRDILPDVASKAPSVLSRTTALVNTVVRTAVTGVQTQAAMLEFSEFKDAISGIQFEAILDVRTSEICRSLDGNIYKLGDPSLPQPPLHPNCRSVLVPIANTASAGVKGGSAKPLGRVSYADWLKKQPVKTVEQIIGKKQAKMFLNGDISLGQLIGANKKPLSIEQLEHIIANPQAMNAATTANPAVITPVTEPTAIMPQITLPPPPVFTPGASVVLDDLKKLIADVTDQHLKTDANPLVANGFIPNDKLTFAKFKLKQAQTTLANAEGLATNGGGMAGIKGQVTKAKKLLAEASGAVSEVQAAIGKSGFVPAGLDKDLLKAVIANPVDASVQDTVGYLLRLAEAAMSEAKAAGVDYYDVGDLAETLLIQVSKQTSPALIKKLWTDLNAQAFKTFNAARKAQGLTPFPNAGKAWKDWLQKTHQVAYQQVDVLKLALGAPKLPAPIPSPAIAQVTKALPSVPNAPPPSVVAPAAPMPPFGTLARYQELTATPTGGQGGSNPGGQYRGADGVKRYVKLYKTQEQAYSEVIASQLYRDLNGLAPEFELMQGPNGQIAVASKWAENTKALGLKPSAADARKVLDHLGADILTANWDAVGLTGDNILKLADGRLLRVDTGGSFFYRAGGQLKTTVDSLFSGGRITEFDVFQSASSQYSSIFRAAGVDGQFFDLGPQVAKIIDLRRSVGGNGKEGWEKYLATRLGSSWQQISTAERAKFVDFLHDREQALKLLSTQQRSKIIAHMQGRGDDNAAAWLANNESKKSGEALDPLPPIGKLLPKPVISPKLNAIDDADTNGSNDWDHSVRERDQNASHTAQLSVKPLSQVEFSAYRAYTGSQFEEINATFRSGGSRGTPSVRAHAKNLEMALERFRNDQDAVLFRGLGRLEPRRVQFDAVAKQGWAATETWLDGLVGREIKDEGFMSTSYGRATPRGFAADNSPPKGIPAGTAAAKAKNMPIFYRIKAQAGSLKGLSGQAKQNGSSTSSHPTEMEFVVQRGTRFRVTGWSLGRYGNDTIVILDMEPW